MAEPRNRGQQPARHGLSRRQLELRRAVGVDERELELPSTLESGCDQILAFAGEEPEVLAPAARTELAHELQPRIGRGADQARHLIQLPWKSTEQKTPLPARPEGDLELVAVVALLLTLSSGARDEIQPNGPSPPAASSEPAARPAALACR